MVSRADPFKKCLAFATDCDSLYNVHYYFVLLSSGSFTVSTKRYIDRFMFLFFSQCSNRLSTIEDKLSMK